MYFLRQSNSYSPYRLVCQTVLIALLSLFCSEAFAQQARGQASPARSFTAVELERLLDTAYLRTTEYADSFRDLTAEEKQSVELYNPLGVLIKRREILSDFVVYQSRFKKDIAAEYRNVRAVDKVEVPGREERVMRLFKKLAATSSVNQELALISDETSRYDLNYSVQGYTLKQGLALQPEVRAVFAFEVLGSEKVDGQEAIVVGYRQRAPSPLLKVDLRIPSLPKASEPYYRGRLWLDARTAQLRREERDLVLEAPMVKEPLVLIRQEFLYTASPFGILVPQRITLTTLGSVKLDGDHVASSTLGGRLVYEYGPFSRFNVVVPGANVQE